MSEVLERVERSSVLLHLRPVFEMDDNKFDEFCRINRDLRIELTAEGDLVIMPPTYSRTGNRNFKLTTQFGVWVERDGTGVGFDSSSAFVLPNNAKRSPDVSWIKKSRLATLTDNQKNRFLPLCPDFVLELRSASDSLEELQAKMREYIENGAQLGWLIDPSTRQVDVYRADGTIENLNNAESISGDPLMPGFVLNLRQIWEADF